MNAHSTELARYVVNGLVATAAHYATLKFNLEVLNLPSAAVANMLAAVVGITVSFLGSRYFVFRKTEESIAQQIVKFSALYGVTAILHGLTLFVWTDWLKHDYRTGFLMATGVQVSLSYFGNKFLVFRT